MPPQVIIPAATLPREPCFVTTNANANWSVDLKHITRESLSQFKPKPPNHNVVLIISGHKRCTGSKFSSIRNWAYGLIEKHTAAGGKVVINCSGSTDPLHRISSWPGFAVSTNVVAKSQPLQLIANFDASTFVFEQAAEHHRIPQQKAVHWDPCEGVVLSA